MDGGVRNTIMSIHADTHLFGSKEGYRTLAHSAGVDLPESNELSAFGFGQTGSSAYLEALATEPSAYGRQLRSGRVGITRCLRGCPDDAGRPTLLLCTLLIAPQDYEGLVQRGLESVINDSSIWVLACFESGEDIPIRPTTAGPPRSVRGNDLGVLDAWLTSQLNRGSVSAFFHERKTAETVLALPQVLEAGDRLRYRWGVNLLSGDAPVDVCTFSRSAKQSGRRKVNRFELDGQTRNAVVGFLRDSLDAGTLRELPSLASMLNPVPESSALPPKPLVLNQEADIQMPLQPSHKRRVMTAAAISFAGVAVVASVLALGAGIFRKYQDAREEHTAQIDGAVAMDTSTREQDKQEESVDLPRVRPKSQPANTERDKSPPAPPESPTKDEDQPRMGDTETPPPVEFTFDVADTPQDHRTRSMLDDSANEGEDDDTSGPPPSNREPAPKDMTPGDPAMWFGDHSLLKVNVFGVPDPLEFDDQYGQTHLQPYVEFIEDVLNRIEKLDQFIKRDKENHNPVSVDDIVEKNKLLDSLIEPVEELSIVLEKYIDYLSNSYVENAEASNRDKQWRDLDWLKRRHRVCELLLLDADIFRRGARVGQKYLKFLTPTDRQKRKSRELWTKIKSWKQKIGGEYPNPHGLLRDLVENKRRLSAQIKRREPRNEGEPNAQPGY